MVPLFIIFAAFLTLGFGEEKVITIQPCPGVSNDCSINEVRIDPCSTPQKCILKQGTVGRMSIDFTPNFDASKMKFGLYWDNGADVPFPDLESDNACNFTNCPVHAGQSQSLVYSLRIGKKLPRGTFPFKCNFWNEENKNQTCCFKTNVQIRK